MTDTNKNADQNQNKGPIQTPGTDKTPEQLLLEKDKADQTAKNAPKSDQSDNKEVKKV